MNTDDLRRIAVRAEGVEGRQADRLVELRARIRAARRRRAAAGAVATLGVVVALVAGAAAVTGTTDKTQEPIDKRTPQPTPTRIVETPRGQVTIQPEIGPGDIQGWELRESRTNAQPGLAGATDLSVTVETGGLYSFQSHFVTFCNGDPDTWWVLTMDLGGVDGGRNPDGSMQDGSRAFFGSCSQDDPTTVPAPTASIEPGTRNYREPARAYPMRMFVTGRLTEAAQQCLGATLDTGACLSAHALTPLEGTDATFGFGIYEHRAAPVVLSGLGGSLQSQALTMADGVEYLVDRAVVAASGASRLVVALPASNRSVIVAVASSETAALERCAEQLGLNEPPSNAEEESADLATFDRRCIAEVELRVDGQPASDQEYDFYFGEHQVVLPPGDAHEITVEVVRNDPANIRFALVVWEERS